jgi:hypothetical protein
LSKCEDFVNDVSQLTKMGEKMGTTVDLLSTKVHCEIAGEGVEYSWGQSKNKFLGICCFMLCSERLRMQ